MPKSDGKHARRVKGYYHTLESVLGYRMMVHGVKHFGLHPNPKEPVSIAEAQTHENDVIARKLNLSPEGKALECGCGEGSAANYLAKKYQWQITGIDLLPQNIRRANRRAKRERNKNDFLVADYMHLPFADNSFDAVYAMETLVHAPDPHALFQEIHRVLKPQGKLVFCEYSMTPREQLSAYAQKVMTMMNTYSYMPSLERFTTGAFPKILKGAGFTHVVVDDVTRQFLPTLKIFWAKARRPNKIIKALHAEKHFINAYSAAETYELYRQGEKLVQYNLVSAICEK